MGWWMWLLMALGAFVGILAGPISCPRNDLAMKAYVVVWAPIAIPVYTASLVFHGQVCRPATPEG